MIIIGNDSKLAWNDRQCKYRRIGLVIRDEWGLSLAHMIALWSPGYCQFYHLKLSDQPPPATHSGMTRRKFECIGIIIINPHLECC